ncbi:MAG: hypothetical protein GY787_13465 [Alteromonadales bacterium]|nr:hypothetical protein [Alteromonadales bacterium]
MAILHGGQLSRVAKQYQIPEDNPTLGQGEVVQSKHIKASLTLVKQAVVVLLTLVFIWGIF